MKTEQALKIERANGYIQALGSKRSNSKFDSKVFKIIYKNKKLPRRKRPTSGFSE
jgi:hypothetical protein